MFSRFPCTLYNDINVALHKLCSFLLAVDVFFFSSGDHISLIRNSVNDQKHQLVTTFFDTQGMVTELALGMAGLLFTSIMQSFDSEETQPLHPKFVSTFTRKLQVLLLFVQCENVAGCGALWFSRLGTACLAR